MYVLDKLPKEIEQLALTAKQQLARLLPALPCARENVSFPGGTSFYAEGGMQGRLFVIRSGVLKFIRHDKLLYYCDEGDLVGIENVSAGGTSTLFAEFAVKVDEYDYAAILDTLAKNREALEGWNRYVGTLLSWTSALVQIFSRDEAVFSPSIMLFQPGDEMVAQGSYGDEVFTLMEGRANVLVDGVKVGEIVEEEMFGAVALLTDKPRLASVVAATDCMVVRLSKEEFINLVQTRPDTIFKLANDLSRAIMALNEQVVAADSSVKN